MMGISGCLRVQGQPGATGRLRTSRTRSHGTAVVCRTPKFASMMWALRGQQWTHSHSVYTL